MAGVKNSLRLGSDHATNVQRQHIAWQQSAQEHIDATRNPGDEFRNFVRRLQGGSHALTRAFQAFRKGRATMHGVSPEDFKAVLRDAHSPLNDSQITQLFSAMDKDNNGTISFDEMVAFVNGKEPMTLKLFGDWQRSHTLERAAQKAQSNAKLRKVQTAAGLQTALSQYFEQQTNSSKGALKVFRKMLQISGSDDAKVSVGNLLSFLHRIDIDASRDAIIGLFAQVDSDNNGLISLSEFSKFFFGHRKDTGNDYYKRYSVDHIRETKLANVKVYNPSTQLTADPLKVFRQRIESIKGGAGTRRAFEKLLKLRPTGIIKADKRNISRNEFISIMLRMQISIPVADLHRIFDALDRNGDDELAFEEFLKFFDHESESKQVLGATTKKERQRPPSALESKIRSGGDAITGLVAVIRRAFARDFFGYYKKLQIILSSLKPREPVSVRTLAEMMAALHIHANSTAVFQLHRKVSENLRNDFDKEDFLNQLFAACGTTFAKLSAAARARPPSASVDAHGPGGAAASQAPTQSMEDKILVTRALKGNSMLPARALKKAVIGGPGGYRETMIRLITCLKHSCRYHTNSRKLAKSDITVRNLVRAVQDAAINIPASAVQEVFAGLDHNASGRISCGKFLRVLKMVAAPGGGAKPVAPRANRPVQRLNTPGSRPSSRPSTAYAAADNLLAAQRALRDKAASKPRTTSSRNKTLQRALADARKLAEENRRARSATQGGRPGSARSVRPLSAAAVDQYSSRPASNRSKFKKRGDLIKSAALRAQANRLAEQHAQVVAKLKSKARSAAYVRRRAF